MRNFTILLVSLFALCLVLGCDAEDAKSSDAVQSRKTEQAMREAIAEVGMPAIKNWQELRLAKMIFELRDQADLVCYAYGWNAYKGELVFLGKCIGYGLPYSVQYTNPEKIVDPDSVPNQSYYQGEGTPIVVPQPDPNGLFMPPGLSATWVMFINPKTGQPEPVYVEQEVTISPFPLH